MIKIRPATQRDLKKLINLRLKLLKTYPHAFLETYQEVKPRTIKQWQAWFKKTTSYPHSILLVAEDKNQLVGMVGCEGKGNKKARHVAEVFHVGVLPTYTAKGVGKKLMNYLFNWIKKETKIHRLQLFVYSDNTTAISFYTKFGFKKEGLMKDSTTKPDGSYQDFVVMAQFFS